MVAGIASVMSVQDELFCVRLVMPHCMFGMQLFLSELVSFVLTKINASCMHKTLVQRPFNTQQPDWVFFRYLFTVCFSWFSPGRLGGNLALS